MGLLDALTSIAGGASPEHNGVADALSQVMQEHPGGMDGLLNQLKQNGLGEQVQSWVGPGQNQAVSPDQVQQGLGSSVLENIAQRAGISPTVATSPFVAYARLSTASTNSAAAHKASLRSFIGTVPA